MKHEAGLDVSVMPATLQTGEISVVYSTTPPPTPLLTTLSKSSSNCNSVILPPAAGYSTAADPAESETDV